VYTSPPGSLRGMLPLLNIMLQCALAADTPVKETLGNPGDPRDNGPVIAGHDWGSPLCQQS
jgi:hypothetical protein